MKGPDDIAGSALDGIEAGRIEIVADCTSSRSTRLLTAAVAPIPGCESQARSHQWTSAPNEATMSTTYDKRLAEAAAAAGLTVDMPTS
ncbi:hypothetical protein [Actinoplanes sp. RD1]|uniref:hypothetical protein n=1 Tax=Actinoplanes sp. RD1 TaxID=3064538 RepID=UPI002741E907|nr:hypothetical protein [Actinoplanes sp. RD1]